MTNQQDAGEDEWELLHANHGCSDEWLCDSWRVFHKTAAEDTIVGSWMSKAQAQDLQSLLNGYAAAARRARKLEEALRDHCPGCMEGWKSQESAEAPNVWHHWNPLGLVWRKCLLTDKQRALLSATGKEEAG